MKGHEEVREAHRILREGKLDLDYRGFVEGDDITKGAVDVIVTDGFTGNVALKTTEGAARFISAELRARLHRRPAGQAGRAPGPAGAAEVPRPADPSPSTAAPLLGLNGIVVEEPRRRRRDADFATAIRVAADLAQQRLRRRDRTQS